MIAQHRSIDDAETGGCFTVKKYQSEKTAVESGGGWVHQRIILMPDSTDSWFQQIVLEQDDQDEVRVPAELVVVLV